MIQTNKRVSTEESVQKECC